MGGGGRFLLTRRLTMIRFRWKNCGCSGACVEEVVCHSFRCRAGATASRISRDERGLGCVRFG